MIGIYRTRGRSISDGNLMKSLITKREISKANVKWFKRFRGNLQHASAFINLDGELIVNLNCELIVRIKKPRIRALSPVKFAEWNGFTVARRSSIGTQQQRTRLCVEARKQINFRKREKSRSFLAANSSLLKEARKEWNNMISNADRWVADVQR